MNGSGPSHDRIEVVEFDERWEAAQTEFAKRNWPGKARRADPSYLRWEYRGAPTGPVPGLLLALDGETVVGQLGIIPGEALVDGRSIPVGWIGNLMVEPDYRRRGVGREIFGVALGAPGIILGTDPSPLAVKTLASLGFSRDSSSDLFVLPLRAGPVVSMRYPQLRRAQRAIDWAGRPALAYVNRHLRAAQKDDRAQVCSWADVVALVAADEDATRQPHSVHNRDFLQWRCSGFAPFVREADAIRTESGSFALLERAGERLLVLHWQAVDADEAAAVLARTVFAAEGYGMSHVQAMASGPEQASVLEGLGFRRRRTPTDLWCYPANAYGTARFVVQGYDTDQNL